jgi:tyrosine-protein phosphatase SIW14
MVNYFPQISQIFAEIYLRKSAISAGILKIKTMKKKVCILSLGFLLMCTFAYAKKDKPTKLIDIQKAVKVELKGFKNLYKVSDSIYRSEQPGKKDFVSIETIGVKSVLSLQEHESDKKEAKGTSLVLLKVSLDPLKISKKDVFEALQMIRQAKKPILVHCENGATITGCIIAAYRMVFQGWEEDDAIKELKYKQFGFKSEEFPAIEEVLKDLDVEKIRKKLGFE